MLPRYIESKYGLTSWYIGAPWINHNIQPQLHARASSAVLRLSWTKAAVRIKKRKILQAKQVITRKDFGGSLRRRFAILLREKKSTFLRNFRKHPTKVSLDFKIQIERQNSKYIASAVNSFDKNPNWILVTPKIRDGSPAALFYILSLDQTMSLNM